MGWWKVISVCGAVAPLAIFVGCSASLFPIGRSSVGQHQLTEELSRQQQRSQTLQSQLGRMSIRLAEAEKELARRHEGTNDPTDRAAQHAAQKIESPSSNPPGELSADQMPPLWKSREPSKQSLQAFSRRYPAFVYQREDNMARLEGALLFSQQGTNLTPQAQQHLKEQASLLQAAATAGFLIMVSGRAAEGAGGQAAPQTPSWNLAAARAAHVATLLQQYNVPRQQIASVATVGFSPMAADAGSTDDSASTDDSSSHRVEIYLLDRKAALTAWRRQESPPLNANSQR